MFSVGKQHENVFIKNVLGRTGCREFLVPGFLASDLTANLRFLTYEPQHCTAFKCSDTGIMSVGIFSSWPINSKRKRNVQLNLN